MAKIIFMGTPEIAVPTLEALNNCFGIDVVVTTPDKPKGRGMQLTSSPVKQKAQELNIEVLQPLDLKSIDFIDKLRQISPDLIVVFAFKFLPKEVYTLAKIAAFNIHTSLLPEYRGAAPISWAIINGEKTTGLTTFILEDKIDGGPIIMQKEIAIPLNSTAGDLTDIIMNVVPNFAITTCKKLISRECNPTIQAVKSNKLAPKIYKNTAEINWMESAIKVKNFINGYSPQPCAWTTWDDIKLQILRAKLPDIDAIKNNMGIISEFNKAGEFYITKNTMFVNCGDYNVIELVEIKPANKNTLLIKNFINGYKGNKQGIFR